MFKNMSLLRRLANLKLDSLPKNISVSAARSLWTSADVLNTRKNVVVLDSYMSYLDTNTSSGVNSCTDTCLFLHGNPTYSYLWRNVIPHVQPAARCLAPDLIGMGFSGKSPAGHYRFVDHYRYLSAWIDTMELSEKLHIVCHDWGSALGFHWANQNRGRIQSITHMESLVCPVGSWDTWPPHARQNFQDLRSTKGEELVLKQNMFVERLLPEAILRKLEPEEMDAYRFPYTSPGESRLPTLTWPREVPIMDDGPADVIDICREYFLWLCESDDVPKLYIDSEPGFFAPLIRQVVEHWPNQQTVVCKGSHYLQEDSPDEIGAAIFKFIHDLKTSSKL